MWNHFSRVLALIKLLYESWVKNSRSSLLYIEVWKICCKLPAHQIESFQTWLDHQWSLCLIWLLSYEGSISNPFQVWRNTVAGIAVVLVLLQTQNRVVEVVVVHFVQLSFFNALNWINIQCLQIHLKQPLFYSPNLL